MTKSLTITEIKRRYNAMTEEQKEVVWYYAGLGLETGRKEIRDELWNKIGPMLLTSLLR